MAVRIHFTAEDLARTRIAGTMGPLAETILALSMLRRSLPGPAAFRGWQDRVSGRRTAAMRPLEELVPPGSCGLDVGTYIGQVPTFEQSVAALLAMPRELFLGEMRDIDRRYPLPAYAWAAAEVDSDARLRLAIAAHACYGALVEPYWPRMLAHLEADRVSRGGILMDGGVERLLATLHPALIRWRAPVLELLVDHDVDVHLGGAGLVLVPSLFIGNNPAVFYDLRMTGDPVTRLVYPAIRDPGIQVHRWEGPRGNGDALTALVGRTRAVILASIAGGCTVSELADRAGISPALASRHAAVLSNAGLATARRDAGVVSYALTDLGAGLLHGPGTRTGRDDRSRPVRRTRTTPTTS
jgi:DNA-binding transcriptional ArsR family regulator